MFAGIAAVVFMFAANSLVFAQKGIGAKYGARNPQPCEHESGGKQADRGGCCRRRYLQPRTRIRRNLYLVEDVKITSFGKGQRPSPNNRLYPSTPDLDSLEYDFTARVPRFTIVAKVKKPNSGNDWRIEFYDADGV